MLSCWQSLPARLTDVPELTAEETQKIATMLDGLGDQWDKQDPEGVGLKWISELGPVIKWVLEQVAEEEISEEVILLTVAFSCAIGGGSRG